MKMSKKILSVFIAVLLLATTMAVIATPTSALGTGDTIQFGNYPQTKVSETTALKNAANAATWRSYGYYIGTGNHDGLMQPGNWMQFADFFVGNTKYRAVKFTQYRPWNTSSISSTEKTKQDENGYVPNTTYYFKYEPLSWHVLSGKFLLCEYVIDAQAYQNMIWEKPYYQYYQSPDATVYANNYTESSIRAWLNNDFYETAFTDAQKANIVEKKLSHGCGWDTNYSSEDTTDKIFMLSYSDAVNGTYGFSTNTAEFSADKAKNTQGTDYAKCQGLSVNDKGNSGWWLRSPGREAGSAEAVTADGVISHSFTVNTVSEGVRPACILSNLSSDTAVSTTLFSSVPVQVSTAAITGFVVPHVDDLASSVYSNLQISDGFTIVQKGVMQTSGNYLNPSIRFQNTTTSYRLRVIFKLAEGYTLGEKLTVTLNGEKGAFVKNSSLYTLNHSFHALPLNYTVAVTATEGGTASGGGTYRHDETVTLTATHEKGYHFVGWYNGETLESTSESYSFSATEDVTLTARFEKGTKGGLCPWCGKSHTYFGGIIGFFQGIIGFFHNIFAKIFGARY